MARFMLTRVDKTPREEEKPIVARNRGLEKREKDKIRRERERERERSQQESNNMRQSKSTMEAAVAQQVKQQSKYQQMQQQQAQQQQQQQHNWHKYLWAGHFGGPGAQQQGQTGQSPDSQSQQQQQAQQWHHLQQYYNVPHHLWGMYNYHHPQQQQQYQQQQQQAQQQQAQSPTAQQQSGSKSSGSKTSTEQQQSSPGPSQAQTQQQQQQTQQQQQQTVQQYAPGPMMPHFYHPHFYNHNFMHPYLLHNWYNQHHQQQQQAQQQQQMQQQQQQQVQQSMQLSDNRGQGGVTGQSVNFKLPGEQDINSSQKPLMRKTKSNKSQGSTQNSDKSFKSGSDKQSSQQGTKDKDLDPDNDDDDDDMNDVDKINDDSDGMDNSDEYDGEDLDDDNITASSAMFDDEGMNKNGSLGMQTVDPKHLLTDIFDLKDKEPMCRKDQLLERLALEHLMVTKFWNFALYIVDFILWILLLFWIYPTNNLFPLYQLIADVYKFDDHLPDIQDINGVAEYLHFAATEASPQLTLGSDEYIKDPLVKYYISDLEELQAVETGEQHYIDENDAPVGGEFINGRDITVLAWIWGEPQSESMNLIKKLDRKTGTVCWQIGSHNATLRGNWTWGYWDYNQKRQAIKDAKRADQHVLDGIGLKITTVVQTQQTNSLNGNTNSDQNGTQNDNQQQSQPIITQTSTETIPSQTQNYFNNTQLYYNWSNPKPETDPIIIINPNAPNDEIYSKQWILVSVAIKVESIKVENDESKKKTKIGFLYGSQQKEYSWIDAPSETENGGMDDCEKGHVYVGGGGGHVAHVRWLPGILSNSEILYLQKHGRLPWDVLSARNPITHQNAQSYREMDSLPHSESTSNSKTSIKSKIAVEVQKLPIKAVQLAPPVLVQTRAKAVQCDDIVEVKDLVPIFTTQWLYWQVERFCSDYSDIGRYICQWPFDGEKGLSQNYNSKYTNPTQLNAKNDDSEFQSEIDHTTTLNSNLLCADPNLLEQSEELLGSKPTSKPFMGIDHAYVEFLDLFSTHHIMRNSEVMESAGFVDFQTKELRLVVPIWSPGLNAVCQLIILFKQDIHSGHIVSTPKLRIVHQLSNYDNLIFFLLMSILLVCMVLEIYMIGIYRPKKIDRERESWLELIKKDSEMGKKLMENIQTSTIITEGVGDYLPYYSHIDFFDLYFRSFSFSIIFFTLLFYWSNDRDDIQSQRFLKVIEDLSTGIEWDSNDVANQILPTFGESLSEINQNLDIQDYVARLYILIGFVMIYRVVVFLRIQPRCAILFKTIQLAVDDLFHFILVFSFIFFCFATLSHWIFGAKHEDFRTVSLAANTQFMMLVGEFPWTEQVDFFYALYLIIFTVIVFLIMLNFFLAIVVDAYAKTKEYVTICTVELNVLFDIHCIINHYFQSRSNGWPSRMAMLVALLHIDDDDCYNVGIGESEPQMSGSSDRRSMKRGSSTVDGGMSSDEQMTPKGLDGNKKSLRLNSSDTDDLFLNENLNDDNIGNPEDSRESGVSSYGGGPGDSINSLKNSKPGSQPSSVTKTKSDDSKRSRISTNSSDLGESKFVQNIKRGNALTSQNVVSFNIDQSISRSSDLNYGSQSESQALYNDINRSTNFDEADDNYSGMNDSYNNFNDESGYNSDSDTNKQQNQQQSQSSSLNQIDPGPIITKKTCLKLRAFSPTKQLFKSMRSARKYLKFYNEHIPAISFEFSKGDDHDAINLSSNDDELLEHNNLLLRLRHLDRIRYQMAQISQRLECMQKGQAYRPQKNPNKFENLMRQSYRPGVNVPGLAAMGGLNAQIAGSIGTAATSLAQMGGDQLNKLSGIKSGQLGGPLGQQQGLGTAASGPQSSMNLANAIHSISLMQKSAQLWQASTTLGQGKTGLGGDVNNPDPRSSNSMMSMTGFNTRLNQQQQQNQSDPFAGFTVPGPPPMPHPSMFYGLSPFGPGPPAMFPPSPTNNNTTTMSMNPMNPGPDSGTGSTSWKLLSRSRDKLLNKSNLNTREEGSAADGGSRVLKSSELNEDEDIEPNRA